MKRSKTFMRGRTLAFYALILLVFAAPVLRLLMMSFSGPDGYSLSNFKTLLGEKRTIEAIKNTIYIALGSNVFATISGTAMALVVAYTNVKRRLLLETLVLMPFIIPSYITTLAWSGLLTKRGFINSTLASLGLGTIEIYSLTGILLVISLCNIPIVYLSVLHILRKIPVDMEWAARACGYNMWQTLWRIDLPEALPAICSGAILAFLAAIDNFAVPAFLGISSGIPVLSTYIYEKAIGFGPEAFAQAAALSVMLSVIAIAGTLIEPFVLRRAAVMDSIKEDFSVRLPLSKNVRRCVELGLLLFLGIINIVPLLDMVVNSFLNNYGLAVTKANLTLDNFKELLTNDGVYLAVVNSLLLSSITCFICIVIGTAVAYGRARRNSRVGNLTEKCASLTYAIPGIVLSLSMIFHWVEPFPGVRPGVYGTINILIIAYVTRYLILQIKGSTTALISVNTELEEAVLASGRKKWEMWRYVLAPLLIKPVLSSAFLIFVSSLTELTLSSMLASAGTKTIGLTIFNFQQAGEFSLSAAMSTLVVVIIFTTYCLVKLRAAEEKEQLQHDLAA